MFFYIIGLSATSFALYHLINASNFKSYNSKTLPNQKGISILIPCYNESAIISNTIDGLSEIKYDNYEVIFINDGSSDDTMNVLRNELALKREKYNIDGKKVYNSTKYDNIRVIDKENEGKAQSLNIGIIYANKELVCTLDADCILHKDALKYMNSTFQDECTIAAGGVVKVLQMFRLENKTKMIVLIQSLEFLRGFYIYKPSLACNNALAIISGAFGVFRKYEIEQIGGFRSGLGEDIDITLRLQEYAKKHNKEIKLNLNSVCYTECPENFKDLTKQRIRWQKAFIDAVINNRAFLFSSVLNKGLAFHVIIESLLSSTLAITILIIEYMHISINGINQISEIILLYCFISLSFHVIYSLVAIKKEKMYGEQSVKNKLWLAILIDIFCFRAIRVLYYILGTILYFFNKDDWNKVTRTNNDYTTSSVKVGEN